MTLAQDAREITNRLWNAAEQALGDKPAWEWDRLNALVQKFLKAVKDADQVELVLLTLLDRDRWQQPDWVSWDQYVLFRRALAVPPGAWPYALWHHGLERGTRIQQSADYWLGVWSDSRAAYDQDGQQRAREMLDRLREHAAIMEDASW